jgi:hypothetical protein
MSRMSCAITRAFFRKEHPMSTNKSKRTRTKDVRLSNPIATFFHCEKCCEEECEYPGDKSVGYTRDGNLAMWCEIHDLPDCRVRTQGPADPHLSRLRQGRITKGTAEYVLAVPFNNGGGCDFRRAQAIFAPAPAHHSSPLTRHRQPLSA